MSVKEQIYAELERLSPDALANILRAVQTETQAQPDKRLRVLSEIDARSQTMNPHPDTQDRVRDGRSGAMFRE